MQQFISVVLTIMLKGQTLHVIILCYYVTSILSVPISTDNQTITLPTIIKPSLIVNASINGTTLSASTNQREVLYVAASVLQQCTLIPKNPDIGSRIKTLLANGAKLIKFNIQFARHEHRFPDNSSSSIYKPFHWVRTSGRHGTGLLLLQPKYDVLSLKTLELGTSTVMVRLKEWPDYCMDNMNYTDIELLIRESVMNDFQNTSSGNLIQLNPTDSICNMHVLDNKGTAIFRYMCCKRSASGYTTCDYLKEDVWLNVLFVIIFCFKVIVVLFSPRFVPGSFYREKHVAASYLHTFANEQGMELNIVKTKTPKKFTNVNQVFKLKKFKTMKTFQVTIQKMSIDVPCVLTLKEVCLRIKQNRLLPEGGAPVGIFKLINESLIKCKIRERRSFTECCNADIFSNVCCKKKLSWYRLLKTSMKIVVLFLLAIPWVIRVYVYFLFEHKEWSMRKSIAQENNLSFSFPGNITLYVTPLHVIFISVYVLLSLESCLFGLFPLRTKENCKFVLRKCFRDMREMRKLNMISWVIRFVLKPCTGFGGLGICIALVIWLPALPFAALILSFYLFPTLNVTVQLLGHFAVYILPRKSCRSDGAFASCSAMLDEKQSHTENILLAEKNERVLKSPRSRCFKLIIICFCLLSLYSLIFLVMELASFVVEVFVYTMMGLIINASSTLTYISLLLLLGAYGFDCFGSVAKKYQRFSEIMHGVVMDLANKQDEQAMYESARKANNYAFKVKTDRTPLNEQPAKLQKNSEGFPKWTLDQLVLFLSKKNKPLIPKKFYFQLCKMPYHAVPGELLTNYLVAAKEFGVIVIFLAFVLIVVLAFGDIYHISTSNKLLATIAGGFLPFMLRNFVFKSHAVSKIDTDNVYFQVSLNNILDDYIQSWPILDIDASIADERNDFISSQPQFESNNGNNDNENCAEPDASVIEKKETKRAVNEHIDVLIDLS